MNNYYFDFSGNIRFYITNKENENIFILEKNRRMTIFQFYRDYT